MGFKRFSLFLAVRLFFTMVSLAVLGFLLVTPGFNAATLLVLGIVIAQTFDLLRFVSRTNQELSRFLSDTVSPEQLASCVVPWPRPTTSAQDDFQ